MGIEIGLHLVDGLLPDRPPLHPQVLGEKRAVEALHLLVRLRPQNARPSSLSTVGTFTPCSSKQVSLGAPIFRRHKVRDRCRPRIRWANMVPVKLL